MYGLVIAIFNKEVDHVRIHEIKKRLREIPNEPHELFYDILTRDAKRMDKLILCLQLIFVREATSNT